MITVNKFGIVLNRCYYVWYSCELGIYPFIINLLRFDDCVEGGESVVVDTYPVLEEMRKKHPNEFNTLTRVPYTTFKQKDYIDDVENCGGAPDPLICFMVLPGHTNHCSFQCF